jgi:hypothetical protein
MIFGHFRHREERSDEAIQLLLCGSWIASRLRFAQYRSQMTSMAHVS